MGKWQQTPFFMTGDNFSEDFSGAASTELKSMAWPESSCEFETGPHAAQDGLQLTMQQ